MQNPKPHRILTEDPSGFFEDSWEGAKRLARNMYNEPVVQYIKDNPRETMGTLSKMGWESAKEAPGNLYRYAQENPHELWGNAVEAGATAAMGPAGIARYMAMQPTAANEGEDQLTAAIQRRMAEQGKHSLAEVEPGSLGSDYAHGGMVEHALRMLRHHYATDGFVDPRLAEDEKKKQEQQQAIDVAKQIKAIDAGGPTTAGSQPATTEDMSAAINAGAARGDNSMFGDKDNTGNSKSSGFFGNGVLNGYANAAGNLVGGAGSALTNLSQGNFVNAVGDVIGGAGKAAGSIANGYVNGISNIGSTIADTAKSGYNAISNAFTPAPQYVDMPLPPSRPTEEEFKAYNSPTVTTAAAPVTPSAPMSLASSPAQSWAGSAPSITGNTATQFAENPTTSMPMSLGYSAAPNVGMQSIGAASMPMSVDYPNNPMMGTEVFGPAFGRAESDKLGIDMVSGKDAITAAQNEADRMSSRGFESDPITGLTDISNYNSPSFTSDPALVGTSPDSVSYGGLTPAGASAAINADVLAGGTSLFGEDDTADYGPPGGVEVEGNAPEGAGQESGGFEGDGGGGAPESSGTGDGEKRGGRIHMPFLAHGGLVERALRLARGGYATNGMVEDDLLSRKQADMDPRKALLFGETDQALPPAGLPIGQAVGTKAAVDVAKGLADASDLTRQAMQGELPPLPDDLLAANACCYDMMYGAEPTIFLTWAKTHGAVQIADGLGMLIGQAAEAFYLWRQIRPEVVPVITAMRRQLAEKK